jgi:hypothetical protein
MSRPIVPETLVLLKHGTVTPVKVTVVYWALGKPVRFTVHVFPLGAVTVPVLAVPQLVTGPVKVKTIL